MGGCCCCVLVVEEGFETELQNGLDMVLSKLVATKFWSNFVWVEEDYDKKFQSRFLIPSWKDCDQFWSKILVSVEEDCNKKFGATLGVNWFGWRTKSEKLGAHSFVVAGKKKIAAFVVAVFVVYVGRRQEFAKICCCSFCVCICRQEFFFFFF